VNLNYFEKLMKKAFGFLGQERREWLAFLEFIDTYFQSRNITSPLIVEIGVLNNCQKTFYRELLNAEYIGIDVHYYAPGHPDILGDSHAPETIEKLRAALFGRPINLLFIDGAHSYDSVKKDYELYGPLVKHIVAFHDIFLTRWADEPDGLSQVPVFWKELIIAEKQNLFMTFKKNTNPNEPIEGKNQMGIGLVVKE